MALIGNLVKSLKPLLPVIIGQALFILSFQLFALQSVYALIALVTALGLGMYHYSSLGEEEKTDLGLMLTSITIFVLFLGISPLYLESGTWLRNALVSLGFPAFYFLGYVLKRFTKLSLMDVVKMTLAGLSFFVLINLLYTFYRYLPFYQWLYQGQVIYVNGEMYFVAEEVKWLIGLSFVEMNVRYLDVYLTMLIMPLFANLQHLPTLRKHWRTHIWWLLPAGTALLGILLLPRLLPLIIGLLVTLIWEGIHHRKQIKRFFKGAWQWIVYGTFTLVSIMVLLFFVEGLNLLNLAATIKSFGPLRTVLDFPLIESYQAVLRSVGQYPFGGFAPIIVGNQNLVSTGSIVFDTLHQGGIFAFLGLVLTGVFFLNHLWQFFQDDKVAMTIRQTMITIVVVFMLFQTFGTQLYPFVREERVWHPRLMIDEPLWAMMFIWMGMVMSDPFKLTKQKPTRITAKSPQEKAPRKETVRSMKQVQWRELD
jgi:hypothetical protein